MEKGDPVEKKYVVSEKMLEFASRDTTVHRALVRKILEAGLKWAAEYKLGPTEEEVREILSKRWGLPAYDISGNMVESALVACNAWKKQEFLASPDEFEQKCNDLIERDGPVEISADGYNQSLREAFNRGRNLTNSK